MFLEYLVIFWKSNPGRSPVSDMCVISAMSKGGFSVFEVIFDARHGAVLKGEGGPVFEVHHCDLEVCELESEG